MGNQTKTEGMLWRKTFFAVGLSLGSLECAFCFFFANVIYFIFVSNSATPFLTSLQDSVEYNFVHIVSEPV